MKPGDVVYLNSGSPAMTIIWIEDGKAYCEWFVNGKKDGDKFPLTALRPDE
jgi:uncharacterized protein YodC (DUF2158 family)